MSNKASMQLSQGIGNSLFECISSTEVMLLSPSGLRQKRGEDYINIKNNGISSFAVLFYGAVCYLHFCRLKNHSGYAYALLQVTDE